MHEISIFIFRRDYRLDDNTALIHALKNSKLVIPIFIFTPEQLINNPYKSNNCVQFMIESLIELNNMLKEKGTKLYMFFGKPYQVIDMLIKKHYRVLLDITDKECNIKSCETILNYIKKKIDILPNKYINEAIKNIIIYEDTLRRTLYV